MPSISKWRIFSFLLCTIIALIFALPNFGFKNSKLLPTNTVNLGLDLRGGAHLLLDVDFDSYIKEVLENSSLELTKSLRAAKVGYKNFDTTHKNSIQFSLRSQGDLETVKKVIQEADLDMEATYKNDLVTLKLSDNKLQNLLDKVINQSIEIIRMRVDSTGTKEPIIQKQGSRHILLQLPGASDPSELQNILGQTAKLSFHLVEDNSIDYTNSEKINVPKGSMFVKGKDHNGNDYGVIVKTKPLLTGDQLTDAKASYGKNSEPIVAFTFNKEGGRIFAEITKNNSGKRLAIVLDNKLLSSPTINEPILGGSGMITGSFTVESANELSLLLRAGALPTGLKIIEERTVGPNLGADSIHAGKKAGIIGFVSVVIFMIWSYGMLGIFANIALSFTMLYVLALLSMFQATLTLPGIAGIILTIGMAVDANVLIYERIREETSKGVSNPYAVKSGFDSAFATILDSNVTTLVAAFLLYIFGVGAIKGFAVTLTIGILASMFSAIIITKLQIDLWMKYFKPKTIMA